LPNSKDNITMPFITLHWWNAHSQYWLVFQHVQVNHLFMLT